MNESVARIEERIRKKRERARIVRELLKQQSSARSQGDSQADPALLQRKADELATQLEEEASAEEKLLNTLSEQEERQELERAVFEDTHQVWRIQCLKCKANNTPDFDHFTRMFVETVETHFKEVRLWFAGFPITGQIAGQVATSDKKDELVLETTLYWRADHEDTFRSVEEWLNGPAAKALDWFEAWRNVCLLDGRKIEFESSAWQTHDTPEALVDEPPPPEDDLEPRPGDLYIAADDGRMYLVRRGDYEPRPEQPQDTQQARDDWYEGRGPFWSYLNGRNTTAPAKTGPYIGKALATINRDAEKQLASRMIDAGVSLAAIPSTGLPTRGTYCYLINLTWDTP